MLFGSQAAERRWIQQHYVTVAFDPSVENRFRAQLTLGVSLIQVLGTDDVDVVDLNSKRSEVGYSALSDGQLLVGDPEQAEELIAKPGQQPQEIGGFTLREPDGKLSIWSF